MATSNSTGSDVISPQAERQILLPLSTTGVLAITFTSLVRRLPD